MSPCCINPIAAIVTQMAVDRLSSLCHNQFRAVRQGVEDSNLKTLDEYLREAERAHGHLCAGQVLGVHLP